MSKITKHHLLALCLYTDFSDLCTDFSQSFRLLNNYETRNYFITIDYDDLNTFDPELSEKFRENPSIYLPLFENAAQEVVAMTKFPKPSKDEMHNIQVEIINVARQAVPIRQLQAQHISKLVRVPGIITSSTKV